MKNLWPFFGRSFIAPRVSARFIKNSIAKLVTQIKQDYGRDLKIQKSTALMQLDSNHRALISWLDSNQDFAAAHRAYMEELIIVRRNSLYLFLSTITLLLSVEFPLQSALSLSLLLTCLYLLNPIQVINGFVNYRKTVCDNVSLQFSAPKNPAALLHISTSNTVNSKQIAVAAPQLSLRTPSQSAEQSSFCLTVVPIKRERNKLPPQEISSSSTPIINIPLSVEKTYSPEMFGPRFKNLKAKYLVKVEGKGAGLSDKANLVAIWDKPSIKRDVARKHQEDYRSLYHVFKGGNTATPTGKVGIKYIRNLGLFEVKGKGKARVFGDEIVDCDHGSAIILDSFKINGFH